MASKSSSRRPSAPGASLAPTAPSWPPDFLRQQFTVGSEGAAKLAGRFEAMRRIQAQAAQQAIERHAAATFKLGTTPPGAAALAVQSELLRGDLEDAANCWRQLMDETIEMSSELFACSTRLVSTEDLFAAASLFRRPPD